MAHFKKITKSVNTENLIKPRVTLKCRRFTHPNKHWTVICESGWPMDHPVSVDRLLSRKDAREISVNFLLRHSNKDFNE